MNNKRLKCKKTGFRLFQSVDKIQVLFLRRLRRICVFSLTRAAKKHLVSEKPPVQRFFKGAGVVLAGIECSPNIFDFRANGIPVQERVDFFDTLLDWNDVRSKIKDFRTALYPRQYHPSALEKTLKKRFFAYKVFFRRTCQRKNVNAA